MNNLKIYRISQIVQTGYDTYSDAIVCAESVEEARRICPSEYYKYDDRTETFHWWCNIGTPQEQYEPDNLIRSWCSDPFDVIVELIGVADKSQKKGVICASFHAG